MLWFFNLLIIQYNIQINVIFRTQDHLIISVKTEIFAILLILRKLNLISFMMTKFEIVVINQILQSFIIQLMSCTC